MSITTRHTADREASCKRILNQRGIHTHIHTRVTMYKMCYRQVIYQDSTPRRTNNVPFTSMAYDFIFVADLNRIKMCW